MTERITVEVGGFYAGKYHYVRRTEYDETEADVERRAENDFRVGHGEPSGFGQYGTSVALDDVEEYEQVEEEVGGYTRTVRGAPQRVRGYTRLVWRRVKYYPTSRIDTDKTKDTRGGKRRGRWL